jgi:hypothetical protein
MDWILGSPWSLESMSRTKSLLLREIVYRFPSKNAASDMVSWGTLNDAGAAAAEAWPTEIELLSPQVISTAKRESGDTRLDEGSASLKNALMVCAPRGANEGSRGSRTASLEIGSTSEHAPSVLSWKRSHLPTEPWQRRRRAPSSGRGTRWVSPAGRLTKVASWRATHGCGGGSRGAASRAARHHRWQTARSRTRSDREGRRLRTRPRSSGWRSDHGVVDRLALATIMRQRKAEETDWTSRGGGDGGVGGQRRRHVRPGSLYVAPIAVDTLDCNMIDLFVLKVGVFSSRTAILYQYESFYLATYSSVLLSAMDMGHMASAAHEATAVVGWASYFFSLGWASFLLGKVDVAVVGQHARRRPGFAHAPLSSATTSNGDGRDKTEAAAPPRLRENVSRFGMGDSSISNPLFVMMSAAGALLRRVGRCTANAWMGSFCGGEKSGSRSRSSVPRHDTTRQSNPRQKKYILTIEPQY